MLLRRQASPKACRPLLLTGLFHIFRRRKPILRQIADAFAVPIEISQLFDDPSVTDVAINAFDRVSYKRDGLWLGGPSPFESEPQFSDWLVDLVELANGRIDFARPAASVSIGGFRIHALVGGQISAGPSATIRRLKPQLDSVAFSDARSLRNLSVLRSALAQKQNVLIAGPAGAGKTTLLRELLRQFDGERIVTIEDVAELELNLPNSIALLSREANVEGAGRIELDQLLVEALRMSPDRLAVGEIRGKELLVMLSALNTGHGGAGATIHATSLPSVVTRLLAIAHAVSVSESALAKMVVDAFNLVAFVDRVGSHRISGLGTFTLSGDNLSIRAFDE